MAHRVRISDGTTHIDFLGDDYEILTAGGFSPRRAQRRQSDLGGSPYADVVETLAIRVIGTDKGDCFTNLGTLSDLLDQASAWGRGENVTAVYFEYEPTNSSLAASVKAVITGPPPGGEFLSVPGHFDSDTVSGGKAIGTNNDPIYLSFTRRGLWLGATEVEAASASTGNPAEVTTTSFTDDLDVLCPYDIYHQFSAALHGLGLREAFLITTNLANKITFIEAEGYTDDSGATISAQAVADASAGNVLEFDPANNTPQYAWFDGDDGGMFGSFNSDARTIDIYAGIHNTGADTPFIIEVGVATIDSSLFSVQWGRATEIDVTNYAEPRPVWLGRLGLQDDLNNLTLWLRLTATADYTDNLEIDWVCVVAVDDSTNVLHMPWLGLAAGGVVGSASRRLYSEHRMDSELDPRVYYATTAPAITDFYGHDSGGQFWGSGQLVHAIMLGVTSNHYVVEDAANNEINSLISVTRTAGYLTPL